MKGRKMANENSNHEWESTQKRENQPDAIDRALNTVLAKYSAGEPRAGLEERVLANLRSKYDNIREPWWRRPMTIVPVSALAAIMIVTAVLTWRFERPHASVATKHSPPVAPAEQPASQSGVSRVTEDRGGRKNPGGLKMALSTKTGIQRRAHVQSVRDQPAVAGAPTTPKLDQFPSRQPMSEQEAALILYVSEFHDEAVLIAQAQNTYEKELEKRIEAERAENESSGSIQQEN
jgi:hypothetical protein